MVEQDGLNPAEPRFTAIEKSLRESEEKYRTIVDNSLEGIYIVQDTVLQFCNHRMAEMFGFKDVEEMVGEDIRSLVSPDSLDLVIRELKARESGQKEISHYHYTARRKDGKDFEVETLSSRIMFQGKPASQGVMRDISKQRILETQLQHSQKMEAIGTLAGGIAHDFNNILSIIMGYTEISLGNLQDTKRLQNNLEHVLKATHRAKDLIQQILAFSRQSKPQSGPVKIGAIVSEVLKLIRASLPSTIKISQHIVNENYTIYADATQLHQVLMNLCTNAAHAMQAHGGVLEVEVSDLNSDLEKMGEVSTTPSPYLRLTVKDTGHGMTPEVRERIFDPFFTTKNVGEGTGLGLSVVHGIVAGLDGEISVESEPGKGTAFHLFLPLLNLGAEEIEGLKAKVDIPRGNERILLVDDEAALANMGRKMLQQLGYEVISTSSSLEALETFRAAPDSFHLVITDLTMPDMTGIHLAQELFKIKPSIPVIISTGYSRELKREEVLELGFKELLLKPYNKAKIAGVVRQVLNRKD